MAFAEKVVAEFPQKISICTPKTQKGNVCVFTPVGRSRKPAHVTHRWCTEPAEQHMLLLLLVLFYNMLSAGRQGLCGTVYATPDLNMVHVRRAALAFVLTERTRVQ